MDEHVPAIPNAETDWEYPAGEGTARLARPDALPVLSVEGFEGPLDFLLEMVRRHRIDLGRLAILPLIDQFVAAFDAARIHVTLERRGDWLVMATTLLQLKAQLLWPPTPDAAADAEAEAARRLGGLDPMAQMRTAAAWLSARPQLGVDVFPRGRSGPAPSPRTELYVAFLEATLVMLEGRQGRCAEAPPAYQPPVRDLWRVQDAIARVRRLLAEDGEGRPLERFLPAIAPDASHIALRQRAAIASTLMAGLELAREGTLIVDQNQPFGPILLRTQLGSAIGFSEPL